MDRIKNYYVFLILVYTVLVTAGYWKVQIDDAYIYYSYASNISGGEGFVFNPGEKINAATSPLYTLILSLLYFILNGTGISIPLIAHISGGLFLLGTSLLLYKIFDRDKYFPLQYFIPILFLANPLLKQSVGMEMFLTIFLVTFSFYWFIKNNIFFTALFSALAILARPDAVLAALPVFILLLFRKDFRSLLVFTGTIIICILPWYLFSYFYFGTLLSSSVEIKIAQQSTGYWGTGLIFLQGYFKSIPGGFIPSLFFTILLLMSLLISVIKKRNLYYELPVILFLVWIFLYFVVYTLMNPPPYPWYYTPGTILFSIIFSLAISSFSLSRNFTASLIILIFAVGLILPLKTFSGPFTEKYIMYKTAAEYINYTADNPIVAIDEIGILRFYLVKGKVRDILGLVNPEAVRFIFNKNLSGFIRHYNPEFIITEYGVKPAYMNYVYSNEFRSKYLKRKIIKGLNNSIEIYGRIR